ncbi:MAG: SPOR domain-containing protein [Spirochaetes bacterium]|nr:SPOR domain-containing protein [Spirochaetota bacterium]
MTDVRKLIICAALLFILFPAVHAAWGEVYFLLPPDIVESFFPVSEHYMIPDRDRVEPILKRAEDYERMGNFRQAARYYGLAYTKTRDSNAGPYILFKQAILQERADESVRLLEEILVRHTDFPCCDAVRFELARRHYIGGDFKKAETRLLEILENEAGTVPVFTPYVHTFIGILKREEGRYHEACVSYEEAVGLLAQQATEEKSRFIVKNYLEMSRCLLLQDRWGESLDLLRRIIGSASEPLVLEEAHILLAGGYKAHDDPASERSVLVLFLADFPDSVYASRARSRVGELGAYDTPQQSETIGIFDPSVPQGAYRYGQPSETTQKGEGFGVQIGSFTMEGNAQNLIDVLKGKGFCSYIVETEFEGKRVFRVRVGVFDTVEEAKEAKQGLESEGYVGFIVQERSQ